jgi:hypothetical protein
MGKGKKIEINAAIYPTIMSIHLGKKEEATKDGFMIQQDFEPEITLSLPRDAYLIYLQTMANEKNVKEMGLLEKYAYGVKLTDMEYLELISLIMTPTARKWSSTNLGSDILSPFGLYIGKDENGRSCAKVIDAAKDMLRVEVWEGIIVK